MNPKRFLTIGGILLTTIGFLGIIGVFGLISDVAFFHPPNWINWFHLCFGILVICIVRWGADRLQTGFTFAGFITATSIGIIGLLFGKYLTEKLNIPELADPSDHIAHLTVGLLAFWGWKGRNRHVRRKSNNN